MRAITPTQRKIFHAFVLLMLLIAAVVFSDSKHPIRVDLQNSIFDDFNRRYPRQLENRENGVVIIDVDEESLEVVGQWPWPRNILAELVESLTEKGAKVIAFDGALAEEDRSSPHILYAGHTPEQIGDLPASMREGTELLNYDQMFAQAIRKSRIFVTAFTYGHDENKPLDKKRIFAKKEVIEAFQKYASPFNAAATNLLIFSKAAAGNGSFMSKQDEDGVVRRVGMIFTDHEILYPALSLEVLRVAELGRKGVVRLGAVPIEKEKSIDTKYRITFGDRVIPVEKNGILYVHYRHFCNDSEVSDKPDICPASDYISAHKFLSPEFEQEARKKVEGKIVMIGSSAEGLKDLRTTALESFQPGVEVHANVVEQVLEGEYLLRPHVMRYAEGSYIFAVGLFFILVAPFFGVLVSVVLCFTIIAMAFIWAYYVYVQYGLLIDPVYSSFSVFCIFVLSTILSYVRAEARRKQIRNAFGMYVAGDVMADLEKNPEKLKLGGETRELSVMFTDIRNFTGISEGMSPEDLIHLMNDFLTNMSNIVMQHEGTLDKYIGDAMMCFWNAPRDVENHERKACIAALKMQDALEPINEELREKAIQAGKDPILLRAGIGVNTGPCAVGNMGSRQRFAYSALGDAVNIASRMEGQTKYYGVDIIVGQSICDKNPDFAVIELDRIRVVGKDKPITIYALIGDQDYAKKEHFQEWRKAHEKMLDLYRSCSFKEATTQIETCAALVGPNYERLYTLYEKRVGALLRRKKPLPEDWDGTIDSSEK